MLRIGCLGAARITPGAIIVPARERPGDVAITAIAARDRSRAEAFAAQFGVAAALDDYARLIDRDDVDAVYIALPPAAHAEWSIKALAAGKHVLCEKPLCMNATEAEAIITAARNADRVFMEAYHWRHHQLAKTLLAELHASAPIMAATAAFEVPIAKTDTELRWRRDLGGGAMMDLGCYPLHLMRCAFGVEPVVKKAWATWEDGVDAALVAHLDFAGADAVLMCGMRAEKPMARAGFKSAAGAIEVLNYIAPQMGAQIIRQPETPDSPPAIAPRPTTYAAQLENFLDACAGRAAPLITLDDSLAQMRAIDAIYAAAIQERG